MENPCDCPGPTGACPRYGFMKGRKYEVCRGIDVTPENRDKLLAAYAAADRLRDRDPGFLEKAANYAASTVRHALGGFAATPPELRAARLALCMAPCDQLAEDGSCRACGCPVGEKVGRATERCPLLKWPGDALAPLAGCGCSPPESTAKPPAGAPA